MTQGLVAIDWSHDGTKLLSTCEAGRVDLWDMRRDTRTLAELRAFMAARSSWKVVDSELVVVSSRADDG